MQHGAAATAIVQFIMLPVITYVVTDHMYMKTFHPTRFPYQTLHTSQLTDDGQFSVLDLENIKILHEPKLNLNEGEDFVIIVLSSPGNFEARCWQRHILKDIGPYLFLIGQSSNNDSIAQEQRRHEDLLVMGVPEGYKNLSYKTLTGMLWIQAKFEVPPKWIIKTDDDIEVDWKRFLSKLHGIKEDFACHVILKNRFPERKNFGRAAKLYVSYSDWPSDYSYPNYCNGWVFAVQTKNANLLAQASRVTPKLPIDDLYLTGILRTRLNLSLTQIGFTPWYDRWLKCTFFNLNRVSYLDSMAYPRNEWPWVTLYHTVFPN